MFGGGAPQKVDGGCWSRAAWAAPRPAKRGVTICSQTPSAFFALLPHLLKAPEAYALKYFILGGEKLEFGKLPPFFATPATGGRTPPRRSKLVGFFLHYNKLLRSLAVSMERALDSLCSPRTEFWEKSICFGFHPY